jgi:hypothetical protein
MIIYVLYFVSFCFLAYKITIEYSRKNLNREIKNTELQRLKMMNGFEDKKFILFSRHYKLFVLLKELIKILDDNNIQYYICGGLLLGLFRHNNSFIPWDDDIDICVFEKDKTKIIDLISNTKYFIEKTSFDVYKFTESKYSNDNNILIDIFFMTEIGGNKIHFSSEKHIQTWPQHYIYSDELYPIQKMDFKLYLPDGKIYDTVKVSIPNKSNEFLDRIYENWQNTYKISNSHCFLYNVFPDENIKIENFQYNTLPPGI